MPKDARSRRNQLFLLALIVVGIGVFVLFTNIDRAMLRQTLDETYTYVETRLHLYEVDAANDRIKSLPRLQDKAAALRDEMTIKGDFTPSDLNAFADTQRLTGVLVLDGELQLEMQSTRDGNAMQLWKQQLQSDYVRDILDCPQKSYAANIEQDGKLYDFAALARTDAPGLLIAYVKKSSEDVGDLTADGASWWYAFTSFEEQMKSPDTVKSTFLADIDKLFAAALSAPEIAGIIVNPWHCTLQLDKELIRIIQPGRAG